MNITETLLQINKNYILSSIYQNTIYKGLKLYEYFGEEQKSNKVGKPFNELFTKMLSDFVPSIPLLKLLENKDLLKPFDNCVIQMNRRYAKLKDVLDYIDNNNDIIIFIGNPTFFCRKYFIKVYNKSTKSISEEYIIDKEFTTNAKTKAFRKCFSYIDLNDANDLFNDVDINDYEKLKGLK